MNKILNIQSLDAVNRAFTGGKKDTDTSNDSDFSNVMDAVLKKLRDCEEGRLLGLNEGMAAAPVPMFFGVPEGDVQAFAAELPVQNVFIGETADQPKDFLGEISAQMLQSGLADETHFRPLERTVPDMFPMQQAQEIMPETGKAEDPSRTFKFNDTEVPPAKNQPEQFAAKIVVANDASAERPVNPQRDFGNTQAPLEKPPEDVKEIMREQTVKTLADVKMSTKESPQKSVESLESGSLDTKAETENRNAQPAANIVPQAEIPEKISIKVGEVLNIHDADFPEKVAEKIIFKQSEGIRQFDIELSPKELGKININIMFKDGKAVVSMLCNDPKTQALLNERALDIREIIETNTGSRTTVTTHQDEAEMSKRDDFNRQGRHNQSRQEQQRSQKDETESFIQQLRLGMFDSA